jgi:hypothetical protein
VGRGVDVTGQPPDGADAGRRRLRALPAINVSYSIPSGDGEGLPRARLWPVTPPGGSGRIRPTAWRSCAGWPGNRDFGHVCRPDQPALADRDCEATGDGRRPIPTRRSRSPGLRAACLRPPRPKRASRSCAPTWHPEAGTSRTGTCRGWRHSMLATGRSSPADPYRPHSPLAPAQDQEPAGEQVSLGWRRVLSGDLDIVQVRAAFGDRPPGG